MTHRLPLAMPAALCAGLVAGGRGWMAGSAGGVVLAALAGLLLYSVQNETAGQRERNAALHEARLLADVYLELIGGRQTGLSFDGSGEVEDGGGASQKSTP